MVLTWRRRQCCSWSSLVLSVIFCKFLWTCQLETLCGKKIAIKSLTTLMKSAVYNRWMNTDVSHLKVCMSSSAKWKCTKLWHWLLFWKRWGPEFTYPWPLQPMKRWALASALCDPVSTFPSYFPRISLNSIIAEKGFKTTLQQVAAATLLHQEGLLPQVYPMNGHIYRQTTTHHQGWIWTLFLTIWKWMR